LQPPSHSPAKGQFADIAMQPVHRLRQGIATWRLATPLDQKTPKLGYTIGGLPCAIMNKRQDRVPQRSGILGGPTPAIRSFIVLRRPAPPGTLSLVPITEIRPAYDKLALAKKTEQGINIRAVSNWIATDVSRVVRQALSDRHYSLQ
jgi:hypothetical protein